MPTPFLGHAEIAHLLAAYGYLVVALMVGIEGMGIPLPGETTLIAASIVAGTTQELNIGLVIAAAGARTWSARAPANPCPWRRVSDRLESAHEHRHLQGNACPR